MKDEQKVESERVDEEIIEQWGKEHMRTSYCQIMDEIRGTIPPALKMQMELSVAIANRIYDILEEKDMSPVALGEDIIRWPISKEIYFWCFRID